MLVFGIPGRRFLFCNFFDFWVQLSFMLHIFLFYAKLSFHVAPFEKPNAFMLHFEKGKCSLCILKNTMCSRWVLKSAMCSCCVFEKCKVFTLRFEKTKHYVARFLKPNVLMLCFENIKHSCCILKNAKHFFKTGNVNALHFFKRKALTLHF